MVKVIEGNLIVKGKKFGVVASRFNDFITKELVSGCLDTLVRHGVQDQDVTVVWVPGSFEIPMAVAKLVKSKDYDCLISLGTVIRGSTPHFDYIASEVSKGVAKIAQESGMPVIFGVITADTIEQAIERAGTKEGNKGSDAALSAIEMVNLFEKLK
jgi:6,7-dimethyl-8-ribityllumazine synthase